jgi:hypothetical protein
VALPHDDDQVATGGRQNQLKALIPLRLKHPHLFAAAGQPLVGLVQAMLGFVAFRFRIVRPAREKRRSRLKRVRLSRALGPTVLDVGPELTLA